MTRPRLLGRHRRWRVGRVPAGLPGPDALEVGARTLRAGGVLHQTLAVTGYPREVGPGWLQPLLDHPGPIDVAVHVEPVAAVVAAERLRRQLAAVIDGYFGPCDASEARKGIEWMRDRYRDVGETPPF